MVADLLEVNGTAIDVTLEGFTEDRVEGLLHVDGKGVFGDHQNNGVFHALERAGRRSSFLGEYRRV